MTRRWLVAALLLKCMVAAACPLCMGWGQPSTSQRLVSAPQAVLADHLSGLRSPDQTTLRALAAGKRASDRSPEEWRARVALVVPHLQDPEPLAADLAYAELAAAPYAELRTAKPYLDAVALRQWLADPQLAARQQLCLLLLGISGNTQDAVAFEQRLQAAWESGDTVNLSCLLAADLELRGAERVAWVESKYLADPKRSPLEIKAVLLALSVLGNANGAIPRERVNRTPA